MKITVILSYPKLNIVYVLNIGVKGIENVTFPINDFVIGL